MLSQEEKKAVIDLFPFMGVNPVVFDVGSNKGHWADLIIDEFGDKVQLHLFEPNKKLLSFCEIKYEYKNNIYFHGVALLDKPGEKEFYYFDNYNNELSSFYKGGKEWEGLQMKSDFVLARTGDLVFDQLNIDKIDYIKIDCEGSDLLTLKGFDKLMYSDKIGIIQIEYSDHWKMGNHTWVELKSIADKYGYKIYRYLENNFLEVEEDIPEFDNYFLTKKAIHNETNMGFNSRFIEATTGLPKFDLIGEVGSFEGTTTKYMCENMLNEGGRLIAIDPLRDFYVIDDPRYHPEFRGQYQRFLRNTRGLPVELKRGLSSQELPKLHALRMDFWYLDGNHYTPWPYFDGSWAFAMTRIGGYILFDDVNTWAEETKESVYKFINEFIDFLEIVYEGYQVLIRKTGNHYNELTCEYYK